MELINTAEGFRRWTASLRSRGRRVGLVPTMGALHGGHRSLIRRARAECDAVGLYVFVNPLQFGEGEDYERYPRDPERDRAIAEAEGVDSLFTPSLSDMYPDGYPPPPERMVDPGPLGSRFEGASRPGHFRGVLTVVDRLFALGGPVRAYFGEKDAQQAFLVRRMASERHPEVVVVCCPTVREPDGLAISSRNAYLRPSERAAATCLYRALVAAQDLFRSGCRDGEAVAARAAEVIGFEPQAVLDYSVVVEDATFEEAVSLVPGGRYRALVAARLGTVRLIDNLLLERR